jgi:hypothetical protein
MLFMRARWARRYAGNAAYRKIVAGVRVIDDVLLDLAPGEVNPGRLKWRRQEYLIKILDVCVYRLPRAKSGSAVSRFISAPPDAAAHGFAVIQQELT